jgi:hypothetical protein
MKVLAAIYIIFLYIYMNSYYLSIEYYDDIV